MGSQASTTGRLGRCFWSKPVSHHHLTLSELLGLHELGDSSPWVSGRLFSDCHSCQLWENTRFPFFLQEASCLTCFFLCRWPWAPDLRDGGVHWNLCFWWQQCGPKTYIFFFYRVSKKDPKAFRNLGGEGRGSSEVQTMFLYFVKCYQIGPGYSRNLNS